MFKLKAQLERDPQVFSRDEETLRYRATENLRVMLLEACAASGWCSEEVGPFSFTLRESEQVQEASALSPREDAQATDEAEACVLH